jgi:hypothetical protein
MSKITLQSFLRELSRDISSESSRKASRKLSIRLTTLQCLVLVTTDNATEPCRDWQSCRQNLMKTGFLYYVPCPNGTRGANNQIKRIYRLTDKGEEAVAEIKRVFDPIVERINNQQLAVK